MILGYALLLLLITVIPIMLGLPWIAKDMEMDRVSGLVYSYAFGSFFMWAVFGVVFFWGAVFNLTLTVCVWVYSILLLISIAFVIVVVKKTGIDVLGSVKDHKWNKLEIIYGLVFLALLSYQIYYAVSYSRTYMADDGYVAFSSAALADNHLNMTNIYTGAYTIHDASWLQRVIQSFNYYPAYLSYVSGINAAIIAHTVIYVYVVLAAYAVFDVIANQLFKERENRLIFLSLIATLFIWGYHSHYSLTFRLLGPNDSGKAVLAVTLAPFMLVMIYRMIKNGYKRDIGVQMFILSITACCLTLGGIYTFASFLVGTVIFYRIINKSYKGLLYLLWGGTVPLLFTVFYLTYRYLLI